jgi:hypothetical protein
MAFQARGPILALEALPVRSILSIISMQTMAHSMSSGCVGHDLGFGVSAGRNAARLTLLVRIASISYLSLTPGLMPAVGAARDVIPQCVQQAGRNDGFYRRLKWLEAQQAAMGYLESAKRF